jgi:hypothetical protein
VRPPLSFAWRNVLFGRDAADAWALFRVHTASYAGLSTAAKIERLAALASYAAAAEVDFQILRVSRAASSSQYARTARQMLDPVHGQDARLAALIAEHATAIDGYGAATAEVFLAVRLDAPSGFSGSLAGVLGDVRRRVGLRDARGISQRRLDEVLDHEATAYGRAGDYLDVERASTAELQWLLRRTALRGVGEPQSDEHWRPQALVLDAEDEDGGRRFRPLEAQLMALLEEPIIVERDRLIVGEVHQAVLVAGALPETTTFPGRQAELLFAPLEAVGFPVDATFSARWIPNDAALSLVRRRIVDADHAFAEESHGDHGPTARTAVRPDLVRELEDELTATDRPPLLRGQVSFAVGAWSADELEERVRRLRRELAPIALHRPKDIQLPLWLGHLPAQLPRVRRYDDVFLPEQLGAMVPTATHAVGARTGLLIGHTLSGSPQPVLFDATEGSREDDTPAVLCTGTPGRGKTATAQLLAAGAFMTGSAVVDIDPKGDHRLAEAIGEEHVDHVEITAGDRDRGRLDPMRIAPLDMRVELAYSFLTELLPAPVPPTWQTEIRAAVAEAVDRGARSSGLILDRLEQGGDDARAAARALEIHAGSGLVQLGFADRATAPPPAVQKPVTSMRIVNLVLPESGTPRAELTPEERTGRALLRLLAVHAMDLLGSDRSRHKLLILEEVSQLVGDVVGLSLVMRIVKWCRSQNGTPVLIDQLLDGLQAVIDLVGWHFAFGVKTEREAKRVIAHLGLDVDDAALVARQQRFRRGQCLVRDYEGRVGAVQIDLGSLLKQLTTTPPRRGAGVEDDDQMALL